VSVKPKKNRLLFDRLIPHWRRKWSSFDVYKKADTLSPRPQVSSGVWDFQNGVRFRRG